MTSSIAAVLANDLCIGCGLCESVTSGRVAMRPTDRGSLRPTDIELLAPDDERTILAACPAVVAEAREIDAPRHDPIWGAHRSISLAWAGDPTVRHRGSTGGVLTALAQHAITSGWVAAVLHVGPDPDHPARNRWVVSETSGDVLANAGSRYSPTAPLAGLRVVLDRGEPFAIVAKPCDLGALHRYARLDARVDELCTVRLSLVCGGQSRFSKTEALLDRFGLAEDDVAALRYRGFGNPGPTVVETTCGTRHETTYLDLWSDESAWDLETRCKVCPDALGECADVVALDTWPGGAPIGEDEGYNSIVVRTPVGEELVASAVRSGALVLGETQTPDRLNEFQPHQVRKKHALAARLAGIADAGVDPIETIGLRVDDLGSRFEADIRAERDGMRRRIEAAREAG